MRYTYYFTQPAMFVTTIYMDVYAYVSYFVYGIYRSAKL